MDITIATWNINSVRLRADLVARLATGYAPDVLCLQETKCPDGQFPAAAFRRMGYEHIAINGQRGYHGVAIVSRLPLFDVERRGFCDKGDARHIAATVAVGGDAVDALRLHNFYVPAGGDEPDPAVNPKFAHKLAFIDEMECWFADRHHDHMLLVGDLNIAPLEHDVWSHRQLLRVVSHTPVEVERLGRLQAARGWVDLMRRGVPEDRKIFTWWSYRARDWAAVDKGRRLDHVWSSPSLAARTSAIEVIRAARGWQRPSDHAPVLATLSL